jgi:hypothetical protein
MKNNFSSNVIHLEDDVNRLDEEYDRWLDTIYARFSEADMDKHMNSLEQEYMHKRAQAQSETGGTL